MQFGFILPELTDPSECAELAGEAEAAGWDGVFVPDCIAIDTPDYPPGPTHDVTVVLAAMAARTERVRFGPMITPPSRRRPWKLAREAVSLDHLSHGRFVLSVGLGAAEDDAGFYRVGEEMAPRIRAQMLDEALEILDHAWKGETFSHQGAHYQVSDLTLLPRPYQSPRLPVWVVGAWPNQRSMERALRWDGVVPVKRMGGAGVPMEADDIREMASYIAAQRGGNDGSFDIVVEGETPGGDADRGAGQVRPLAEAGATWWLETRWSAEEWRAPVQERLRQGPPRLT